ncbi:hypothetical protein [Roseibium aggregatum]|uniref:Uncharacterized protein n=1 Tax=Roseibium aggregatum TaxID=187304 RepID=A0A926NZZ7_9HYPH|nr:hypothetical protein [Roseibium aggregatum]MBD1549529.1 hypothetical protein [Roseibium aggregatum]
MSQTKPFLRPDALALMQNRTAQARETEARAVFSQERVEAALSDAAKCGQSVAIFRPGQPMDLSDTATAKAAVAAFTAAGFFAEWKTRQQPDCEPEKYLRVSWGADAKK